MVGTDRTIQPLRPWHQQPSGTAPLQTGHADGCVSMDELRQPDEPYQRAEGHRGREKAETLQGEPLALRHLQRHFLVSQPTGTLTALGAAVLRLRPPGWQGEPLEGKKPLGA